jgi:hypothetical protein
MEANQLIHAVTVLVAIGAALTAVGLAVMVSTIPTEISGTIRSEISF